MRTSLERHIALRPALALGLTLALLAPGAAAFATTAATADEPAPTDSVSSASSPADPADAAPADAATEGEAPAPTGTAPTPAAADPAPAPAPAETAPAPEQVASQAADLTSRIALAIEVAKDGNGPFTPKDEPGGDVSATNGIVRTLDAITYRVTMNSNGGPSSNERFKLTAPTGTTWAGVPAPCAGPGSAINGQNLTCNLGTIAEGQAVAVPAVLNISGDLKNGDQITVTGTGTADGAGNGTVSATSPTTTVSAAARYNLSKNLGGSRLLTDITGPDGSTKGILMAYPITVAWEPLVPGQSLLGFERSAGPMTFQDDPSKILGDLPAGAQLWNRGRPACGPNVISDIRFSNLPGGAGGAANSVSDSGQINCTQSAPDAPVDVTITGTVTDPNHIPTQGLAGVLTKPQPYFVSGYITFWMPNPPAETSVTSINRYSALQTTSISGAPNYPGGTEPMADNVASRSIVELAPGSVGKDIYRVIDGGKNIADGSAKRGDAWITPGETVRSSVGMSNNGLSDYTNAILCDTFDRRTQRLGAINGGTAWTAGFKTGGKLQYAAYDMTSPADGQKHTCNDDDGPWYDDPTKVPGGRDAVGAIRAVGTVAGGSSAAIYSYVTVQNAPDGTRAYDFGHATRGDRAPAWLHDNKDPALGAGGLADSVLITENLARIQKKIVDAGHDASDTPDETSFAVAGNTVDYALYPSLTNGNTAGKPSEVTVQDVLPLHTSYVAGSASKTPTIDTIEDADGKQHQRLTWTLTDISPNSAIDPLTYTAAVSKLAPAGPVTNQAVIESPTDRSDEQYRDAQRAVQVVTTGGVGVEKSALAPVVVNCDHLEWKLGYTNTDASPIRDVDLIDVLPFRGDARNSSFHGAAGLADPVQVDTTAGESVEYTTADPASISLDPADPTNQPGGSTTWCAEDVLGTDGCPATLADATAFRIHRTAPVAVGDTVTHTIALATDGAYDQDQFTNRFGLRASNLALPVQSNPATIRVVSGSIGDRVWTDTNSNGIQDDGEPGLGDVPVHLTGTDDLGADVDRTTTTNPDGDYSFGGLRPGDYVLTFTAPDGREFTTPLAGDDRATDSNATADGSTAPVTIARLTNAEGAFDAVTRDDTIDAGVLPLNDVIDPPGPVDPGFTPDPQDPETPDPGTDPENPGTTDPDQPGTTDPAKPGNQTDPHTEQPTAPAAGEQPQTPSTTATGHRAGELAFTGTTGVLGLLLVTAFLLVLAGLIVRLTNRNQRRHPNQ